MLKILIAVGCCVLSLPLSAQVEQQDSTRTLNEVVVHAFAQDRPLSEVPATIGYVTDQQLTRFNNTSVLPAVNLIPGVRMEERSPGSYRFSIRGSLLRSPFGVRDVKMYWNGLPLTDAGGNTYLNLLDFGSIGSMEIIKGPGASLYGAGTGGVVLLQSATHATSQLEASSVFGSYGLKRFTVQGNFGGEDFNSMIRYAHQEADGYREQAAMRRDGFNWEWDHRLSQKSKLSFTAFYSDLYYQTPGGLNLSQYESDPRQARPGTPFAPGAVDQQAAVGNQTGFAGLSHVYTWNSHWSNRTGVLISKTSFQNPSIRNVELRSEHNSGGRTETYYHWQSEKVKGKLTFGAEVQYFTSNVNVYDNTLGVQGSPQTLDHLVAPAGLGFAQVELDLPHNYLLTLGGSLNFLKYRFSRSFPTVDAQTKPFKNQFLPRLAILKKMNENWSLFGSLSQGFSPPSFAEVRPSTNNFNGDLNAQRGTNLEAGVKAHSGNQRFRYEMTLYDFRLRNTIVIQRTNDGADYFINAGNTRQQGIEAQVSWEPLIHSKAITGFKVSGSYTYQHYRFENYVQDGIDLSGNKLTGVPPVVATMALDVELKSRWYANLTGNFTDHIVLNDANTDYAKSYLLVGGRVGFRSEVRSWIWDVFTGMDNALNEKYSLGNDLNAFGGRYYNAAAPRNYYVGANLKFPLKKRT